MTIAYLGPEATFTHQAAIQRFGSSLLYAAQKTIADVFNEVAKGRADYGVVPVENSTEGVVTHTLDMFVDSDLKVVSQIVLPISHCLVSRSRRERIKKLYVHPQSLAQCRALDHKNLAAAEIVETSSNARSAELAAQEKHSAAIAGVLAAETYGAARARTATFKTTPPERHPFPRARSQVQPAHRPRPHQPHVQHRGRGGGVASCARSVPQVPR
jgi:chorismate mutase/prephenate dehydratase